MAREQQRVWALVRTACIMATLLDGGPGALLSDYPGEMEELREHYPLLRDWPEPFRRRAVNRALAELAESERRDP